MSLSAQIRLALVDDHSLVRDGIKALLSVVPNVAVVGEAESGAHAMEMVDQCKPDLLLVDINLPDINGLVLTRTLRERHPLLRVLVLSMHDSKEYVSESLRAGASGYVLKTPLKRNRRCN